jgi:hypothetical protein
MGGLQRMALLVFSHGSKIIRAYSQLWMSK